MSIVNTTGNANPDPADAKSGSVKVPVGHGQTRPCGNCGGVMYKKTIDGNLVWECSSCGGTTPA
ncbi:hypothetical protein TWF730_001916 [Orbilia blumenaviensis]|uniref:Uncharacterized protein n=1 Tax=Orbilia blumenaviensis TaxID=1796055 RepID=A0AAV9UDB1_9PEZI